MYCPRCASNQSDDVKFCKACGANLHAVRQVVDTRETDKKFDWSDTWVAEMFLSEEAQARRKGEMERRLGITPEVKRYNEIKVGVLLTCIGIALSFFLFFFMQGIVGNVSAVAAEILSRVWLAGVIPFGIGVAFIINGVVISKKLVEIANRTSGSTPSLEGDTSPRSLHAPDTSEFVEPGFSVTESTTRHLSDPVRKQ